ncbi:MAG: hypothetical protein ACON49_07735 [Candidatus Puniceispirillaceae bacterium]
MTKWTSQTKRDAIFAACLCQSFGCMGMVSARIAKSMHFPVVMVMNALLARIRDKNR